MIEFSVKKTKIQLDFSFFAVLAFSFFLDKNGILLMSFAACIIHELGHLFAMLIFDVDIRSLCFYGAGIKLGCNIDRSHFKSSLLIYSAGCAANILFLVASIIFGSYKFAAINAVMCLFNILAIGDLDGSQIISLISDRYKLSGLWLRIVKISSYISVIITSLIIGDRVGLTFYFTLIYMLLTR